MTFPALMVVLSLFGSCLGEHIVKIPWVQLPVIDRIHCLAASTPVNLLFCGVRSLNLRQGYAADVDVYLMAAFYMQRKRKTLLSRAGIQKEYFSCKKIKVQEQSDL